MRSRSWNGAALGVKVAPLILRWTAGGAVPSLRAGTPAMTDTPPEFAEDVRPCAGDSGRREAGGKELAKQKAEGVTGKPRFPFPRCRDRSNP